jgi:molybdate transport system ATP-binding protein
MLEAHVLKRRRDFTVDVSLEIGSGGSLGLFGASGSGKSTILSCIAGIEQPDGGQIRFGDVQMFPPSLPLHLRPVGYLTQEPYLFPHLTVARNVVFGVDLQHVPAETAWIEDLRKEPGTDRYLERPSIANFGRSGSESGPGPHARPAAAARFT